MSFQLTLTSTLDEEKTMELEAQTLIQQALDSIGNVTDLDALFRFNETAGRFQLILGDPNAPFVTFQFPTDLGVDKAILLASRILQGVIEGLSGTVVNVQIDSGGSRVFIINYT